MKSVWLERGNVDVSPYLFKLEKSVEWVKVADWSREGPLNTSQERSSLVTLQLLISRLGMVHLSPGGGGGASRSDTTPCMAN